MKPEGYSMKLYSVIIIMIGILMIKEELASTKELPTYSPYYTIARTPSIIIWTAPLKYSSHVAS